MNIYQKLIEVRKAVPFLKKDAKNPIFKFDYVSSSQVLGALRQAMDEWELFLKFTVKSHELSDHKTSKGGHQYMTVLGIEFTWVDAADPSQTITSEVFGYGLDEGEKGIGKALTYAEKYFLLKFFNVPTDKDDPDSFHGSRMTATEVEGQGKSPKHPEEGIQEPPEPKKKEEKVDQTYVDQIKAKFEEAKIEQELVREYLFTQGKIEAVEGVPDLNTMAPAFAVNLLEENNFKLFKKAFAAWCVKNADRLEGTAQEEKK